MTFAGTPGQTYWDEGLQASILALQRAAAATGNADFVSRAHELQLRLQSQWFPVVEAVFIKGDALKLDDDIKAVTGASTVYQLDAGIGGVYGVGANDPAASGDVAANVAALGQDVASSAGDLAQPLAHHALKWSRYLLVLVVLLAALYVVVRARR